MIVLNDPKGDKNFFFYEWKRESDTKNILLLTKA